MFSTISRISMLSAALRLPLVGLSSWMVTDNDRFTAVHLSQGLAAAPPLADKNATYRSLPPHHRWADAHCLC